MYRYGLIVIICVLLFFVMSCKKDPVLAEKRPIQPRFEFFKLEIPGWLYALDDSLAQYAKLTLKNINYVKNLDDFVNCSQEYFENDDVTQDQFVQPWVWNYIWKTNTKYQFDVSDMEDHYYWELWYLDTVRNRKVIAFEADKCKDGDKQCDIMFGSSLGWLWNFKNDYLYSIEYFRSESINIREPYSWNGIHLADDHRIHGNFRIGVYVEFISPDIMSILLSTYDTDQEQSSWHIRNKFLLNLDEKTGEWFCYENDEITTQGVWNGQ